MDMTSLLITISIVSTVLFLIAIFDVCYAIVIKHQIKNLKNELTKQEMVDYINSMPVYVIDEQGNILKHHAYIGAFNLNDFQKIIIAVNKN